LRIVQTKNHRGAIASIDLAIALKPDYAKALHNLGASRQALGELPAAPPPKSRILMDNFEVWNDPAISLLFQRAVSQQNPDRL
jgi:hypothetical protein